MATRWGDSLVFDHVVDSYRLEDVARGCGGERGRCIAGVQPAVRRDLKPVVVPAEVSRAVAYGRAVREAREEARIRSPRS